MSVIVRSSADIKPTFLQVSQSSLPSLSAVTQIKPQPHPCVAVLCAAPTSRRARMYRKSSQQMTKIMPSEWLPCHGGSNPWSFPILTSVA